MGYAGIALANVLPHLLYPLSGYKPLLEHLVPIALRTAYIVCQTYICVLATGLSSLYYPVRPIRRRPMLRMTSTYTAPSGDVTRGYIHSVSMLITCL